MTSYLVITYEHVGGKSQGLLFFDSLRMKGTVNYGVVFENFMPVFVHVFGILLPCFVHGSGVGCCAETLFKGSDASANHSWLITIK